jgi:hypothetical protein
LKTERDHSVCVIGRLQLHHSPHRNHLAALNSATYPLTSSHASEDVPYHAYPNLFMFGDSLAQRLGSDPTIDSCFYRQQGHTAHSPLLAFAEDVTPGS